MKEPDYIMQIMATGGALCTMGGKEVNHVFSVNGETQTMRFIHVKPFEYYFCFSHAVDNHNNLRHAVSSIKGKGNMVHQLLALLCFSFCLAVIEINTYLTPKHFIFKSNDPKTLPKLINFHHELAWQMIDNKFARKDNVRAN